MNTISKEPPIDFYWSTQVELKYLEKMPKMVGYQLEETLSGYLEGCKKRSRWRNIDKTLILAKAKEMLKNVRRDSHA